MPNWKKLITSGSNAVLNDITASGEILIPQYVEHLGDTDTKLGFSANNNVVLVTGGSTRLKAIIVVLKLQAHLTQQKKNKSYIQMVRY